MIQITMIVSIAGIRRDNNQKKVDLSTFTGREVRDDVTWSASELLHSMHQVLNGLSDIKNLPRFCSRPMLYRIKRMLQIYSRESCYVLRES